MPRPPQPNKHSPRSLLVRPFTPPVKHSLEDLSKMPNRFSLFFADVRELADQVTARFNAQQLTANTEPNSETELDSDKDSMSTETTELTETPEAATTNAMHP